jgi:TPP-dependent pyruvate/acetoin dehydrogenase alpha subunit
MATNHKDLLHNMILIRKVEEAIVKNYGSAGHDQEMRCPVHLSIGQEAAASGVCHFLTDEDSVFSTHRCHAHYLAKGGDLTKMILEIHGKVGGCMDGRGGSMHLMDAGVGMLASVPIVASSIPLAVGAALSYKIDKKPNVAICFFGDACVEEGVFHESMNFAALMDLPVIFVCENNLYSVYTHINDRQPKRNLTEISKAHNVNSIHVNGNNAVDVVNASKNLIDEARSNSKPSFLVMDTYRLREHCGVNFDDNLNYRDEREIKEWFSNDPIKILKEICLNQNLISKSEIVDIEREIDKKVSDAFDKALKSPLPDPDLASKFVFSN